MSILWLRKSMHSWFRWVFLSLAVVIGLGMVAYFGGAGGGRGTADTQPGVAGGSDVMAKVGSAKLTRGHRAEAAMLELSFILWWAAGFFSLGIVLALYTLPFYLCCRVMFFRHIEAQADLQPMKKGV